MKDGIDSEEDKCYHFVDLVTGQCKKKTSGQVTVENTSETTAVSHADGVRYCKERDTEIQSLLALTLSLSVCSGKRIKDILQV